MRHRDLLSYQFNMSLGFSPAILSMILYEWNGRDLSIHLGALAGLLTCLLLQMRRTRGIPPLILYSTTGMLTVYSLFSFMINKYCPPTTIPLTLEIITILPPALLLLNRNKLLKSKSKYQEKDVQKLKQATEAALVSSKIILILGFIHFLLISSIILLQHPLHKTTFWLLFRLIPVAIFILAIALNQFSIFFFNRLSEREVYLPIVDNEGKVICKKTVQEVWSPQNIDMIPMIRVAVIMEGMIFLKHRFNHISKDGENDLLIEGILFFGESLEQGIERLIKQFNLPYRKEEFQFNIKYHYTHQSSHRLVYLYLLDITDYPSTSKIPVKGSKPWTLRQIETNLNKQYFSPHFEYEFEYLKTIICTREKYKES